MNNSSQEQTFTITLDNEVNNNINDMTWSWDSSSIPALSTSDVITLTSTPITTSYTTSTIETIDLSAIETFSSFTNLYTEEFDGRFPDFERIQQMCKEYPGLDIAYRKFKEVYSMVKEDFDGKERERRGKY